MAYNFLKKGAEVSKSIAEEERLADLRKLQRTDEVRRFWMRKNSSSIITFLDGDIDSEGNLLSDASYKEHSIYHDGSWKRFVCTKETEGQCPICDEGAYPSTVVLFTVIDHSEYTSKKNEVYKDQVRLFAAKKQTYLKLQTLAKKRGGLTGVTFEATRPGDDKSPAVGDMFDYEEKRDLKEVLETYKVGGPVDYTKAVKYIPYADLCTLLGTKPKQEITQNQPTYTDNKVIGTEAGVEDDSDIPF